MQRDPADGARFTNSESRPFFYAWVAESVGQVFNLSKTRKQEHSQQEQSQQEQKDRLKTCPTISIHKGAWSRLTTSLGAASLAWSIHHPQDFGGDVDTILENDRSIHTA